MILQYDQGKPIPIVIINKRNAKRYTPILWISLPSKNESPSGLILLFAGAGVAAFFLSSGSSKLSTEVTGTNLSSCLTTSGSLKLKLLMEVLI